jgi:hypothetical protein
MLVIGMKTTYFQNDLEFGGELFDEARKEIKKLKFASKEQGIT